MKSIPSMSSIPPAVRSQRIRISVGSETGAIAQTARRQNSLREGDARRYVFKERGVTRRKQVFSLDGEIQLYKTIMRQLEDDIQELKFFANEGIQVERELAKLLERKRDVQGLLDKMHP